MFINTHTHRQLYDARLELVNIALNERDKPKYYSYGLHPWHIHADTVHQELRELEVHCHEPRCLAVGECGLDKLSTVDFDLQLDTFVEQIKIANKAGKPLIVHCVKAFNELINCLNLQDNAVPVIVHGFNNNENIARVLLDHGVYFSFGKALLGYESNAAKALINVGRKHFFLETDEADISIKYIYRKASELLGIAEEILQQQIQANFATVFKTEL